METEVKTDKNNFLEEKKYVFYDLETNGLDYFTTGIMQFTLLDINGNILLNQYTYPFNNKIEGTDIHGIDLEKLKNNKAINTLDLCMLIKKSIRKLFGRDDIYFIAYNNFGYDQIILENNFKICNIKIPNNWNFIDLFPLVKEYIDYKSVKNFKLKTIYEYIYGLDTNIQFHCSLADTTCLYKIFLNLYETKKDFPLYLKKYTRTLLQNTAIFECPISTLNGYSNGMLFSQKKIYTIGDLFSIFKDMKYDKICFDYYLQYSLNIYSDYYRKNIVKQIDAIYYLQ
jgi:DNA polymerase III epsilon subunit-like protein